MQATVRLVPRLVAAEFAAAEFAGILRGLWFGSRAANA